MKKDLFGSLNKEPFLNLGTLLWALPTFLATIAIVFELIEHIREGDMDGAGFIGEMIIFGIVGPVIIAIVIAWMRRLMATEKQALLDLQTLNRELEQKVAMRTSSLEQHNDELRQLDEMKSDFVSLVSHELRAPLTALNGGLELALQL